MHWLPGNIGKLITKLILPQNLYLLFSSQFLVVILFSEYVLFTFLSITVVLIFFPFQFWSWVQFNVSCQTICNSFLSCILDGYNSSSGIFFFLNFYLLFSERERGRHQFVIPLIYAFFGWFFFFFFFWRFYLSIFRERGRETERERNIDVWEKHRWVAFSRAPARNLVGNPGMHPDQESNWWSFSLWGDAQPYEPHQSGPLVDSCMCPDQGLNLQCWCIWTTALWPTELPGQSWKFS